MDNKISIKSDDLKDVCSKILTAVDTTEVSTITETLALNGKNGVFTLAVTNQEYFVEATFPLVGVESFSATVNAGLFLKLVSQITTPDIELETRENYLIVKGNGTYKLPMIFDGDKLLELPPIDINHVTTNFAIDADILNSILVYNSKEISKATAVMPVQKMYYVDELGAITFTNGACVNEFVLPTNVKLLLNSRLVKLFKLFREGNVNFVLGHDALSDDIIQTKVQFSNDAVKITAILSCDDALINKVPVAAIRKRANNTYPYSIVVDRNSMLQTINRISIFNKGLHTVAKTYGVFEIGDCITVYDANKDNKETITINNKCDIPETYSMCLNLDDLRLILENCTESHICVNFGDHAAVVFVRGNIKNVIPEVRIK